MSESAEVQSPEVEKSIPVDENQTQEVVSDEVKSEDINDRLLRESQKWKKEAQELKALIEKQDRDRLKAKGDMAEYAKSLEKELEDQKNANKNLLEDVVWTNIKAEVAAKCPDARDIDTVLSKLNISSEDVDVHSKTIRDLDTRIAIVRKNHGDWLFKQKVPGLEKSIPKYQAPVEKSTSEMTNKEYEQYLRNKYK